MILISPLPPPLIIVRSPYGYKNDFLLFYFILYIIHFFFHLISFIHPSVASVGPHPPPCNKCGPSRPVNTTLSLRVSWEGATRTHSDDRGSVIVLLEKSCCVYTTWAHRILCARLTGGYVLFVCTYTLHAYYPSNFNATLKPLDVYTLHTKYTTNRCYPWTIFVVLRACVRYVIWICLRISSRTCNSRRLHVRIEIFIIEYIG